MKKMDFIITSLQSWDIEIGSTIKNTAQELSKSNRVLYVNTPMDHVTWLRGNKNKAYTQRMDVIKGRKPYLRQLNENMWVVDCPFMVYSINKISNSVAFDFFNRINNKKIARFISKVASELGFDDFIHLIDNDIYRSFYLKDLLNPAISMYYRRDYVIGEAYWRKHGARIEKELVRKSDIVLANSLYFANELKEYNPNTFDIETGVNLDLYDPKTIGEIPEDIKNIPHPIIGYVGTVNSTRLDAELLLAVARERSQYSFVFTGPEDDFFKSHDLHSLPNVYFLGNKPVSSLPWYVAAYDVCINPQMINPNTIGNYPLKIDEYLAMGKPVVATRTHTMEHIFSEYVFLCEGKDEYLNMIDRAVAELASDDKGRERIEFAHTHSWENSVKKILGILDLFKKQ